jgi:hypothetical protein
LPCTWRRLAHSACKAEGAKKASEAEGRLKTVNPQRLPQLSRWGKQFLVAHDHL